ncbi:TRAFs-binding domain-containing protein [Virgibacillus sediminis]|uniref:TRAFs-binding domain-containing protein n=1 Tax=Virgibacillus sediminis TaxID=202260 RepID=A0ABV7A4C6_9BACI
MSLKPLVFVAMPFGKKSDDRTTIDFNAIYEDAIKPAIREFEQDLEVIRADEETIGGFIHGPMYERLLLSEIVIADLTLANSNVFYELGIRHTARPKSTILLFSKDTRLPFDVLPLRAIPYELTTKGELSEEECERLKKEIKSRIVEALAEGNPDSPLFQLISDFPGVKIKHDQANSFRERLFEIESLHEKLADLRHSKESDTLERIKDIESQLGHLESSSYELLYDLLMSYRSIESWEDMVRLIEHFPLELRESIKVQEQLALALNRRNKSQDRDRAIRILNSILENYGDSSETLGILGRIYKDRYFEKSSTGDNRGARGALKEAINCYYKGFEEDPRDYYPGINLLTLLFIQNSGDSRECFDKLKPLVKFSLERQGDLESTNYWVIASLLEFASLCKNWNLANEAADKMLNTPYGNMEIKTTLNNLNFILNELEDRNEDTTQLKEIIDDLSK